MNKAIFLDRDGVILTERRDYNYIPEHIDFVTDIVESCRFFQEKGFLLIVITNQAGISKGIYRHKDVRHVHQLIREFFRSYGVIITDFYYCPHHESQTKCLCRKPDSLLLEKAMAVYQIDASLSYFIGDSDRDVAAATKAGINPVKIEKNTSLIEFIQHNEIKGLGE